MVLGIFCALSTMVLLPPLVRVFGPLERMSKIRDSSLPAYFNSRESGKRFAVFSSPDQHAVCCGSDDIRGWCSLERGSISGASSK
jgi:hypothetical protein